MHAECQQEANSRFLQGEYLAISHRGISVGKNYFMLKTNVKLMIITYVGKQISVSQRENSTKTWFIKVNNINQHEHSYEMKILELPYDPAVPLLSIFSKEMKSICAK